MTGGASSSGSGPRPRRLAVLVDGVAMPDADARALWERFSTWMEEHHGDLAGFAAQEGYASVHPGVDGDHPVLRASKSAAQRAYEPVREGPSPGGSPGRRPKATTPDRRGSKGGNFPKKPRP